MCLLLQVVCASARQGVSTNGSKMAAVEAEGFTIKAGMKNSKVKHVDTS